MNEEIDVLKLAYKLGELNADLNSILFHLSKIDEKDDVELKKQIDNIRVEFDGLIDSITCDNFFHDIWKN